MNIFPSSTKERRAFSGKADATGAPASDPARAVELGQSLCPLLAQRGQNTADIASQVSETIGQPIGAGGMFTGAAISLLCPRAVDRIAQGQPLLPLFGCAHAPAPDQGANASSMISCCSTACTFDEPDEGADMARREMRLMPVSFSGSNSGNSRPNVGQAP